MSMCLGCIILCSLLPCVCTRHILTRYHTRCVVSHSVKIMYHNMCQIVLGPILRIVGGYCVSVVGLSIIKGPQLCTYFAAVSKLGHFRSLHDVHSAM